MKCTHVRSLLLIVVLISVFAAAPGCSKNGGVNQQQVGGLLGGIAGGVVGSQFGSGSGKTAATIAGVLVGAAAGSYIGSRMDEADRLEMNKTLEYNKTGQTDRWRNPDTGAEYAVTPTRTYQPESGRYCREYTQKIWIDSKQETATGTACRRPDGTWEIVDHKS